MSINSILVIISVWSGVIIFFSAVVAPTVFKSLEEKEAGVFLRAFFPKYYNFGIFLGIAGLIYIFFMSYMDSLLLGLIAFMTILTISGKLMIPVINNARDAANEKSFKTYHLISVLMNVVTLILGLILLGIYI
ncbi:MAG: DUF4149 domain-containing protein [Gammaproteobacteria bacterium]|nr:DUF4149 domain-containing protein [Gammaproteobacteria bacterium]MBL6818984.1 DUF4149 domain-containing protein [Gammaproteobacteria bacterium]MBL6898967.1 DUF4149 domain-containing protein [Gammaproteobacteria bacterium]